MQPELTNDSACLYWLLVLSVKIHTHFNHLPPSLFFHFHLLWLRVTNHNPSFIISCELRNTYDNSTTLLITNKHVDSMHINCTSTIMWGECSGRNQNAIEMNQTCKDDGNINFNWPLHNLSHMLFCLSHVPVRHEQPWTRPKFPATRRYFIAAAKNDGSQAKESRESFWMSFSFMCYAELSCPAGQNIYLLCLKWILLRKLHVRGCREWAECWTLRISTFSL